MNTAHRNPSMPAAQMRQRNDEVEQIGRELDAAIQDAAGLHAMLERLQELGTDVYESWTAMTPDQRTAVRVQSEQLYDSLGALSTYLLVLSRAAQR